MDKNQIENFRILGDFLIDYRDRGGSCGFDMGNDAIDKYTRKSLSPETMQTYREHNLIASSLGFAGLIYKKLAYKLDIAYSKVLWLEYSDKYFGVNLTDNNNIFHWCFSGNWKLVDNTSIGAGKRILWLCDHGLPLSWQQQMLGDEKLCYVIEKPFKKEIHLPYW